MFKNIELKNFSAEKDKKNSVSKILVLKYSKICVQNPKKSITKI